MSSPSFPSSLKDYAKKSMTAEQKVKDLYKQRKPNEFDKLSPEEKQAEFLRQQEQIKAEL